MSSQRRGSVDATPVRRPCRSPWRKSGEPWFRRSLRPRERVKVIAISPRLAGRIGDLYALTVIEAGADATGYVFPGRDGVPMDASTPSRMLARACVRAGLVDEAGAPLVSWHGLRHTAASLMLAAGVPLPDVSALLRHANAGITARVYSHTLGQDRQHAAASVFDGLGMTGTLRETLRETAVERQNPLA